VHGLGASGPAAWPAQHALAARWRLIFPHRPGYGGSPRAGREDFEADAALLAELLGEGAHLVGQSYGAVVALLAAARRPRAVWSLTAIEPPAPSPARGDPDVDRYEQALRALATAPPADPAAYLRRFLALLDPGQPLPATSPALLALAAHMQHNLRSPLEAEFPTDLLMAATFPKLFVSGGRSPAHEAICDSLALQIGGDRKLIPPTGPAAPLTGQYFNAVLEAFMQAQPLP
jgi:pimeloyl-ACP methyl ester carboxylesterase